LHFVDSSNDDWKENYKTIKNELKKYGGSLDEKKEIIVLTKSDLSKENIEKIKKKLRKISGQTPLIISCFSEEGLEELIQKLFDNCEINDVE